MNRSVTRVALYARVSSERQAQADTIASQVEALRQRIASDGLILDPELAFLDEGHSGATLIRPALERLRDQVAAGAVDRLYVHSPDRLARNFAHQFVLLEEFARAGLDVVFLNRALGDSPEDQLLLQVQGVIAEYERAKISERSRRGKLHAARRGQVSVLGGAPYGYRYIPAADGSPARYVVVPEEARVVQQIFAWAARERLPLRQIRQRLCERGIPSPKGKPRWNEASLLALLRNPAYQGKAAYGKHRSVPRQPRLRPARGQAELPARPYSRRRVEEPWAWIDVPALVSAEEFAAAAEQRAENRARRRACRNPHHFVLSGLVVCGRCSYACAPLARWHRTQTGRRCYGYYRCKGRDRQRPDGQSPCTVPPCRSADLEAAVWQDVCQLLHDPARIEAEFHRRLDREAEPGFPAAGVDKALAKVKRSVNRLIDAYSEGLLDKDEFEPRLRAAKERLRQLETEAQTQAQAAHHQAELRLVLGKLQDFASQIREGLSQADWATRREIIRALVKRIEVQPEEVRIVYRVNPAPFVRAPDGGLLHDCWKRACGIRRRGRRSLCLGCPERQDDSAPARTRKRDWRHRVFAQRSHVGDRQRRRV